MPKGSNTNSVKHFDCLKNVLPDNFTNENISSYYAACFWKKCDCEHGVNQYCLSQKSNDKWDICNRCENLWSNCKENCGKCKSGSNCKDSNSSNKDCPCANPCKCNCNELIVKMKPSFQVPECDNIVELRLPKNGSKARYVSQRFSEQFIDENRYQCATVPQYLNVPNNFVIDNMREQEFTESDQRSLVMRGVKSAELSRKTINRVRHAHVIPASTAGKSAYYYFGSENRGSTITGLPTYELTSRISMGDPCCNPNKQF